MNIDDDEEEEIVAETYETIAETEGEHYVEITKFSYAPEEDDVI